MRIIARTTIEAFLRTHPAARPARDRWQMRVRSSTWAKPQQVAADFATAKVLNGERVRFEVQGGSFRLIVAFDFRRQIA